MSVRAMTIANQNNDDRLNRGLINERDLVSSSRAVMRLCIFAALEVVVFTTPAGLRVPVESYFGQD